MNPARILILTPTPQELDLLQSFYTGLDGWRTPSADSNNLETEICWETCGVGLIEAAVGATQKILANSPVHVILAGIAGSYSASQAPVGTAHFFRRIACFEIGIGRGQGFHLFERQQLADWNAEEPILELSSATAEKDCDQILSIATGHLLSVTAASNDEHDVRHHLALDPQAVAEEMEGYAVAVASRKLGVPLTIIRGISNIAGDRDKRRWTIPEALHAVADQINRFLATIL